MSKSLTENGRQLVIALLKVLDTGLNFIVPLGLLLIGVLQLFPDYRLDLTFTEIAVDLTGGIVFILPLCLFSLSLAAKLFRTAQIFPVKHWGFFVGIGAAINCILLVTLIYLTERVDAFWIVIPHLMIWLVLRYNSYMNIGFWEKIRGILYGLFVTSVLLTALSLPILFGIKYKLSSPIEKAIKEKIESMNFSDNHNCFRTVVTAYATPFWYGFVANEEFDMNCAEIDTAKLLYELLHQDVGKNEMTCLSDEKYIYCITRK